MNSRQFIKKLLEIADEMNHALNIGRAPKYDLSYIEKALSILGYHSPNQNNDNRLAYSLMNFRKARLMERSEGDSDIAVSAIGQEMGIEDQAITVVDVIDMALRIEVAAKRDSSFVENELKRM
jgi:hypothetical protein